MPGRRGKPRSEDDIAENAEPLSVLDLDDPEVGIRPEDRFAAIPPGPRLVPRRLHHESTRAPVLLLAGLLAVFLLGSWLGSVGSDEEADRPSMSFPVLDVDTGATLLLVAPDNVAEIDVGGSIARPVEGAGDAVRRYRGRAIRVRLLPSATPGRAWLVTTATAGMSTAREIELADGRVGAELAVEGSVLGATTAGLVVEHDPMTYTLVAFDGVPIRVLDRDAEFLGAADTLVATSSDDCGGSTCAIRLQDVETGDVREITVELAARGSGAGSLAPDGRRLAYTRSDGVETHGVLVDLELETTTPFRARAVRRDTPGPHHAWSPGGDWLFLATTRNGLDAVATADGTNSRVDADLPPFTGILTR